MSYTNIVVRTGPLPILETWPPIYRDQERMGRADRKQAKFIPTFTLDTHLV
jgi:hypothetical protein